MKRFKVDSESGNVLFLILIAVVLFAALSYAVTSSTNSSGGNVDEEALQLEASRLIGWAASAQASFQRRSLVHNQVGYFGGSIYQFYIVLLPR